MYHGPVRVLLSLLLVLSAGPALGRTRGPCNDPPVSWRVLRRLDLVRFEPPPGVRLRDPERAWGSRITVSGLQRALARYRRQFPDAPPLWVHDISQQGGGRISDHCSHQTGQDVDLRLPLRDPVAGFVDATPRTLHVGRTWFLLLALARTCDVELIFLDRELQRALWRHGRRAGVSRRLLGYLLQYPYRRASGLVRHRDHHKNHMHVRFRYRRIPLDLHGARRLCGLDGVEPDPPVERLLRRAGETPLDGATPRWLRAPLP